MEDLEIEKFSPTVAELQRIVEESKKITVDDLRDPQQMGVVVVKREELRRYEIKIEKTGKKCRAKAIAFQKEVIAQEKELKAITSPEIERLKGILSEAKEIATKEERLKDLPHYREKLEKIGDKVEVSDEELLAMNYDEFMIYHNQRIADKIELDRQEIEDEKNKLARDKEIEEAKKQATKDAEDRIKNEQATKEREEKEQKEAKEKAEKDERDRLADQVKYQTFLKENGYNEEDFITKDLGDKVVLYKQVAIFTK